MQALCDGTKILTDTETETFYPRQFFPILIPRPFSKTKFSKTDTETFFETKFSKTDTETFILRPNLLIPIPRLFSIPNFSIPIPRLSKKWHMSRDWDRNWDRDRDFCIWLTTFRDLYRQLLATFGHLFFATFFLRPNIPIPIPRLFPRPNFLILIPRIFSETKFSDTDTKTFFPRPNFPIPIPRLLKNWQKSRDWEVSRPRCHTLLQSGTYPH